MADLSLAEKRTLEQFFSSAGSNNWFVTHGELSELFDQHELSNHGYVEEGGKTDRMRIVWKTCPNGVVSKLLLELLEIGFADEAQPTDEWLAGYAECKGILQGLRFKGGEEPEIELARSFFRSQAELVLQDWSEAKLGIWVCQYMVWKAPRQQAFGEIPRELDRDAHPSRERVQPETSGKPLAAHALQCLVVSRNR